MRHLLLRCSAWLVNREASSKEEVGGRGDYTAAHVGQFTCSQMLTGLRQTCYIFSQRRPEHRRGHKGMDAWSPHSCPSWTMQWAHSGWTVQRSSWTGSCAFPYCFHACTSNCDSCVVTVLWTLTDYEVHEMRCSNMWRSNSHRSWTEYSSHE